MLPHTSPYALPAFFLKAKAAEPITEQDIIKACADYFRVSVDVVMRKGRYRQTTGPRMAATFLIKEYLKLTHCNLARLFNQDHSTITNSIQVVKNELGSPVDSQIRDAVIFIRKTLLNQKQKTDAGN